MRIGFRFAVVMAALLMLPHLVPLSLATLGLGGAAHASLDGWHWLVSRFGDLIGIELGPPVMTGSGDQLRHYIELLFVTTMAAVATIAWSLLDRRRAHPRIAAVMTVLVRYYLAVIMIGYGMAKVVPMQFPPLWLARYDQSIGEMSPMGLLWTFMGHSQAYTMFAGLAEVAGAVLLLWRRTYVIGALVLAIVMTNVVVLNFCYDVPVKLFSMQLLVMALALLVPHARRLLCAVLGRATPEVPPRVRGSIMGERVRFTIKYAIVALIALRAYGYYSFADEIARRRVVTPLHGIWRAEHVVIDGIEHPPLFTDDARWHKLIFHEYGLVVRYATDRRAHFRVEVDDQLHTITLVQGLYRHVWRYERTAEDRLIIRTPDTIAVLVREPPPLLPSRGFHWINEEPFHR